MILINYDNSISSTIKSYYDETKDAINEAINLNYIEFEGSAKLVAVSTYNARKYENYIITFFFLMIEQNNKEKVLHGNFVVELEDGLVKKVYKF